LEGFRVSATLQLNHYVLARTPGEAFHRIALCSFDGADVDPHIVTLAEDGELVLRSGRVLHTRCRARPDLQAVTGGTWFRAVPRAARVEDARLTQARAAKHLHAEVAS